jgi:serine/threonine protein kinase
MPQAMPAGALKLKPEPGHSAKVAAKVEQHPGDLNSGQVLAGRYCLERPLRSQSVWLASAEDGSRVVVKTGPAALIDNEFRVLTAVAGPGVVSLRERFHQGADFIVLDYLDGGDLVSLAGSDPARWLGAIDQLLVAVARLDRCGFVHRDIKARNVMLDSAGDARLIDFGSALPAGSPWTRGGTTTVAPDRGDGPIAIEDDLYALAALIYELLHGAPWGPGPAGPGAGKRPHLERFVIDYLAGHTPDFGLGRFAAVIESAQASDRSDQ